MRCLTMSVMLLATMCCILLGVEPLPNLVVIYADDLGYGDLSCYGNKVTTTPVLDRLASEGVRCTDFYVAQAVCGASRTALLTGCYPNRVGILGAPGPGSKVGINRSETTLAELCKSRGYATAIFGKWHLGDHRSFLPLQHGFDRYYGLPYSNDMWPIHPDGPRNFPKLPLIEQNEIINADVTPEVQTQLVTEYTQRAVEFITQQQDRPFFLYIPYAMPHVPLFVSDKHRGKSKQGLYGDVLLEIDWSVGQILQALDKTGVAGRTMVMFASDNGPWLSYGDHAGSAGPLREGKGTAWDGGVRVPCIVRWPGKLPAGRTHTSPWMTIDLLPTWGATIGATLPEHKLDGRNVLSELAGQAAPAQQEPATYYFYWGQELHAVRQGKWKLHFPHSYRSLTAEPGRNGKPAAYKQLSTPQALFNLETDIGEQHDVAADHPEIVKQLTAAAELMRQDLGDSLTKQQGAGRREPGRLSAAPQAKSE